MIEEHNGVRNWASILDDGTRLQAERLARCPVVEGPVALMPDAHVGIGATVGSVIRTRDAVIPAAVGVDIGCGMIAVHTGIRESDVDRSFDGFVHELERTIPAGVGRGHAEPSDRAIKWLRLNALEEFNDKERATAVSQLGTLGSGNHFFEVCVDQADNLWLVLHSGSRGIGNQLAQRHIKLARAQGQALEDPDLAYFLAGTREFHEYVRHMIWAQDYAWENRQIMMDAALAQFYRYVGVPVDFRPYYRVNCHHNYCERDEFTGLWVTRKGAIDARERKLGVIPGSMGASSFIVSGLGNEDSYNSAPHGAGRQLSRGRAKREIALADFKEAMAGRAWQEDRAQALLDEAPQAYKDIHRVMEDSQDLVWVVTELTAVVNYKGV